MRESVGTITTSEGLEEFVKYKPDDAQVLGKFKITVMNEDGSIDKVIETENVAKNSLFQTAADAVAPFNYVGFSKDSVHYTDYHMASNQNYFAIGLFNDPDSVESDGYVIDEGDLVGYFDLDADNADGSHPTRGNRVLIDWVENYNATENGNSHKYVGEFFSNQANGSFNKIGFIMNVGTSTTAHGGILAEKWSSAYSGPYLTRSEKNYSVRGGLRYNAQRNMAPYAVVCGTDSAQEHFVPTYETGHTNNTTRNRYAAMTSTVEGHWFAPRYSTLVDETNNIIMADLFNTTELSTAQDVIDNAYVYNAAPKAGLDWATGKIATVYKNSEGQGVLYFIHKSDTDGTITVTPVENQGSGGTNGWVELPQMSVDCGVIDPFLTMVAAQQSSDEGIVHILGYIDDADTALRTYKHITLNLTKNTCSLRFARDMNEWVQKFITNAADVKYKKLRSIAPLGEDTLLVQVASSNTTSGRAEWAASTDTCYRCHNGSNEGQTFFYIDSVKNKSSYAGQINLMRQGSSSFGHKLMTTQYDGCYTMGNYCGFGGWGGELTCRYCDTFYRITVPFIDPITKELTMFNYGRNGSTWTFLTSWPFRPVSSCHLATVSTFPAIEKVVGQTLKIEYTITTKKGYRTYPALEMKVS